MKKERRKKKEPTPRLNEDNPCAYAIEQTVCEQADLEKRRS
jgi:hypothetical protein